MIKSQNLFIRKGSEEPIPCKVTLSKNEKYSLDFFSNHFAPYCCTGVDYLDCFNQLRKFIESQGFILLVNGTVKNTWASGGLRDSSQGELTYLLDENLNKTVLNIFEFCDRNNVTYEEQIKYYKNWLKEHR